MPDLSDQQIKELTSRAQQVLNHNWNGRFTSPAPEIYPHQWSWDSGFITIGYSHCNQERAEKELDRLFKGQWANGMIPHILYDEEHISEDYFPDADFWKSRDVNRAPNDLQTSGICQPPIHATAVRNLLMHGEDQQRAIEFASKHFEALADWHRYLYDKRDLNDNGLVYIHHPWESGQDNSPLWDPILEKMGIHEHQKPVYTRKDLDYIRASERPTKENYDRYIWLVELFRDLNYDEEAIRDAGCPFLAVDVLFNSILCQANLDLALIAGAIGEDPDPWEERYHQTKKSINKKLWDEESGVYLNLDLREKSKIDVKVLSGFLPLYAGIPDINRADKMMEYLNTASFCRLDKECFAAPSYDKKSADYSTQKYWRGPIWMNLNWLICIGLAKYEKSEYSERILNTIIELPMKEGFYEYYDPETGDGYGSEHFAWTAALLIDALYIHQKRKESA